MHWDDPDLNWPNASASRFISERPHRWHVQDVGSGPILLLIHGAGGATHTWRSLIPTLAKTHRVVALDLPGQGFSKAGTRHRSSLDLMSEDIGRLIDAQGWEIDTVIAHSAGSAIALKLALNGDIGSAKVIGINPALANFKGLAGVLFPMFAKLLSLNPFTANVFVATSGSESSVKRLIEGTGSVIDDEGMRLYTALISDRNHVDATLAMMAHWSLDGLVADLPNVRNQVLFLIGENDKAVPPDTGETAAKKMPNASTVRLPNLGHLAHEEDPEGTHAAILNFVK
ncbi:MAG: alpha/beta fold hydrolase BchO [Pseudomonadota bacterium]